MPMVGFEPAIPASEQLQTYALHIATTGIGNDSVTGSDSSLVASNFLMSMDN